MACTDRSGTVDNHGPLLAEPFERTADRSKLVIVVRMDVGRVSVEFAERDAAKRAQCPGRSTPAP